MRTGSRHRLSFGVASVAPASRESSRLGLAVPRSAGGAVVRNRIKRRIRAAFLAAGAALGHDVVIHARAEAVGMPFQEMEDELRRLGRA